MLCKRKVWAPKIWAPKIWAPKIWAPKVWAPKIWAPKIWAPKIRTLLCGLFASGILVASGLVASGVEAGAVAQQSGKTRQTKQQTTSQPAKGVTVTADEAHQRVDISIDGRPFTSYVWPTSLKKPVLYPLIAPNGIEVTRGFPLAPRDGERVDHPHHAGMWFNYGNVNGFDFWNNSDAIKPENRAKMGTIHQEKIVSTRSGAESGELVAESLWVTGAGQQVIRETARYVFTRGKGEGAGTGEGARIIDEIVTLHALDRVVFNDDKEGLMGLRVAHFLESANEKGGIFKDANGVPTKVANVTVPGATGVYLTSEGKKGDDVWGTRGRWCTLTGTTVGDTVSIAILDHPGNPGFPTYWHARGYGLFAANPLGRSIFDKSQPAFNFTIEKGHDATFRYRVILLAHAPSAAEMNKDADAFAAEYR